MRVARATLAGGLLVLAVADCGGVAVGAGADGGSSSTDHGLASEGGSSSGGNESDSSSEGAPGSCASGTEASVACDDADSEADAGVGPNGDATIADATVDVISIEGAVVQADATVDATAGVDGPVKSSVPDGGVSVIASEPGLFYGGCSPVVAGGKVFFCSASAALDGTVVPIPSATIKSVAVTGGTPISLGTIVSPETLPFASQRSFADTANVYFVDSQTNNSGTRVLAAPIAGGSTTIVGSYVDPYGPWASDGTLFFGGIGGTACNIVSTPDGGVISDTCTTQAGLVALPTDGGAPTFVVPQVIVVGDGGLSPYAPAGLLALGADPGAGSNVYAQLTSPSSYQPLSVSRIAKDGIAFDLDAGPTGGFPELAPNLAETTAFVALASDGTNAFGLGFTSTTGFATVTDAAVERIPTDGAPAVMLATTSYALFDLIIDSGNAYWITATRSTVDSGPVYRAVGERVTRVATSGVGSPVTIYDGTSSPWGTPTGVALDAAFAYVTTAQGNLVRVPK